MEEEVPEPPRKKRAPVVEVQESQPMDEDGWGQPIPSEIEAELDQEEQPTETPPEKASEAAPSQVASAVAATADPAPAPLAEPTETAESAGPQGEQLAAEVPGKMTLDQQSQLLHQGFPIGGTVFESLFMLLCFWA